MLEVNKTITWCAGEWGCDLYEEENFPAQRMQRILKEVVRVMPDKNNQKILDAWIASRPPKDSSEARNEIAFVNSLQQGFAEAADRDPPEDMSSKSETDRYFHAFAESLLGETPKGSTAQDYLPAVQRKLYEPSKGMMVGVLLKAVKKDSSLESNEKERLLLIIRDYQMAISLVSGDRENCSAP